MSSLALTFLCECNNKQYHNKQSLNAHKKTKFHINWMNSNELKHLKVTLTEKDNEINKLSIYIKNQDNEIENLKHRLSLLMF